jgi:hypothetical protein
VEQCISSDIEHSLQAKVTDVLRADVLNMAEFAAGPSARIVPDSAQRLLSASCREASAWLDELATHARFEVSDTSCAVGPPAQVGPDCAPRAMQRMSRAPLAAPSGRTMDDALQCHKRAEEMTLRFVVLKGILRRIIHRAGVASSLEPTLCRLPSQAAGGRLCATAGLAGTSTWC